MDLSTWLRDLGLESYAQAFQANDIDAEVLSRLTADDLIALGISSIGHRRKLLDAIAELPRPESSAQREPEAAPRAAERRQLTVMFVDLVGSTELSARLDPEDMGAVIRGYQQCCAEVVERWGGHVAKYMGDGVLAYFGWPRAHEDEAERAVRAGLALVAALARLETTAGEPLAARVGIATGLVMVGELIGEGAAREEAVVGETPNLAARLQALAAPGSVVISQATRRLVGGVFELDDLGPRRLKGFAEPLAAWRVEGEGQAEGRFEARQTAGLTPLVGRDAEMALLLRRWQQAKDGERHVVLLSGEPGIGKSRLVREMRERLKGEPYVRLLYQCSPHRTTSPLHPLIEQLQRAAGFERDEPPEARLDKLETLLARGTDRPEQAVPLIAALLGLATEGRYPALDLTPQRQKQLTLAALVEQLEGLAAAQPVLLAYEDVHWSDPTTQELLGLTVERVSRLPVLLLLTYRSEFSPPWPSQTPRQRAGAVPARPARGRRPGRAAGSNKPLPDEVAAQIAAKTDGVPLFVEELTKTVLEIGPASGRGRSLRAGRPAAATGAAIDPAQLAARSPRPPRAGERDRADRRRARARVLARAPGRGRGPAGGGVASRARPAGRGRAGLSPGHPARCHLQLQARVGPGRRLRCAAQIPSPAPACSHRAGYGGPVPGDRRNPARTPRAALHRGWADRSGSAVLAQSRATGDRALDAGGGRCASDQRAGDASSLTRRSRARPARARPADSSRGGADRAERPTRSGDQPGLCTGPRIVSVRR